MPNMKGVLEKCQYVISWELELEGKIKNNGMGEAFSRDKTNHWKICGMSNK